MMDYQVRKEYIATVLCENKAKPQLKCNGQCFLAKKLKKLQKDKKEQQEKRVKLTISQSEYVPHDYPNIGFKLSIHSNCWGFSIDSDIQDLGLIHSIYKPPKAII